MSKALAEALGINWYPELDNIDSDFVPEKTHASTKGIVPRGEDAFWYGKKLPLETRQKISKTKTGSKLSEETKKKIRAYKHTEYAKINISKNHFFAKNGRPGHSERMSGNKNPGIVYKGKTWIKDSVTGKRIWINKE